MIKDIIAAIKLLFRKDKELYCELKEIIGFYPDNIELYKQALMHKSIMHRNENGRPINNERLEFLGDAVLDSVVGDIVYHHFPKKKEGFLTNTRSKLVQRETLGKLAREMGIDKLIISSGHSLSHNSYIEGNAFEALVGAMYLDRGYDTCMKFIKKQILSKLLNIDKVAYKEVNFKSKLIEWSQKNKIIMRYELIEQKTCEHGSPLFRYKVKLETVDGFIGDGYSKKESQQMASKLTLERLKKDKDYLNSVFAAKTERTKMEEMPVMNVPDIEVQEENKEVKKYREVEKDKEEYREIKKSKEVEKDSEFDLSDISVKSKSREEIIAEAENAAFSE